MENHQTDANAAEIQLILHIMSSVCSLRYPACKVRVYYYIVICGLFTSIIQGDQKSLCTWWLQYNREVHRGFLITLYFSILCHKRHDYWKMNVIGCKMCFDFLYNFCLKHFLTPRRTERDMIINVHGCSCRVPVTVVRFW